MTYWRDKMVSAACCVLLWLLVDTGVAFFLPGLPGLPGTCKCGTLDNPGYVEPYFINYNEYINFTCTLTNMSYDISEMFFTQSGKKVPTNEMYITSNTTLTFSRLVTRLEDSGTYFCRHGDIFIEGASISVEYPPLPVRKDTFLCTIYDWDQKMECDWDFVVPYKNLYHFSVVLILEDTECPSIMDNTKCIWTKDDGAVYDRELLHFKVNITHTKRQISYLTENITISQVNIVKPSSVDTFSIKSVHSTCVALEWHHPREDRSKVFTLYSISKWNDSQVIETLELNKTICNLRPYTEYSFSIETRPGRNTGYPSTLLFNSTTTNMDKPEYPPQILKNNYFDHQENCMERNEHTIIVSWHEIEKRYENGPMMGYNISILDEDGNIFQQHRIRNISQLSYSAVLPCDQEMTFSIRSCNQEGCSSPSTIVIEEVKYLKAEHIAGIACGGIVVLVLIVIGMVAAYRYILPRLKKIKEPFPIETIKIQNVNMNKGLSTQVSKDSGRSSMSNGIHSGSAANSYEDPIEEEDSTSPMCNNASVKKFSADTGFQNEGFNMSGKESKENGDSTPYDSVQLLFHENSDGSQGSESASSYEDRIVLNSQEDEDGYRSLNRGSLSQESATPDIKNEDPVHSYVVQGDSLSTSDKTSHDKSVSFDIKSETKDSKIKTQGVVEQVHKSQNPCDNKTFIQDVH